MKTLLYANRLSRFEYDSDNLTAWLTWLPTTNGMTQDDFKQEVTLRLNTVREYGISKLVADDREFNYTVTPVVQEWVADSFKRILGDLNLKRHAIVVPEGFFAQISVEQTFEEVEQKKMTYQVKHFSNLNMANNWVGN